MSSELKIQLRTLLHEIDAAVSASEQSFNRIIQDSTDVAENKTLHFNALNRIRMLRKILTDNLSGDLIIKTKERL